MGSRSTARQPPTSERFSSVSAPPCASAICRHRTRPMPDPPGLVVKNGTNRLRVLESPGPSSSTVSSKAGGLGRHPRPADADAAGRLGRRVDRVLEQVDQQLLDLVGVGLDGQVGPALDGNRAPLVEPCHLLDQRPDPHRLRARRRQAGQLGVGGHEAAQRLGAGRDDAEAVPRSTSQSEGRGSRCTRLPRLPAIDLIGASELFSS